MAARAAAPRSPGKVYAGRSGAIARWHGHAKKTIRIDDLRPEQRRLVLALIQAVRGENERTAAEDQHPAAVGAEGTLDAQSAT